MRIIDTHPHAFAAASPTFPHAPLGGVQSAWSQGIEVTPSDLLMAMDAAGVERAIVVQTSTVYGYDNRYVAQGIATSTRLNGICSVDPTRPDVSDVLASLAAEHGFVGVRLFSAGKALGEVYRLDRATIGETLRVCEELGLVVDIQTRFDQIDVFAGIAKEFGGVRFVLDHLGGARIAGRAYADAAPQLFGLSPLSNVSLKFSGHNLERLDRDSAPDGTVDPDLVPALVAEFGADRVLWGSNYPNTFGRLPASLDTYVGMVAMARGAVATLNPQQQEQVLAGTADKMYGLVADE